MDLNTWDLLFTGEFTAPVSGTYAFHFHGLHYGSSEDVWDEDCHDCMIRTITYNVTDVSFRLNDDQIAGTYKKISQTNYYKQMLAISVVLKLEENDVVDIFLNEGKLHGERAFLSFKGYLLF